MSTARSLIAGAALGALAIALGADVASAQLRGPIVTLSSAEGKPGAEVTATVEGFGKCPPGDDAGVDPGPDVASVDPGPDVARMDPRPFVVVSWDGDPRGAIRPVGGNGKLSFRVPEDAGGGRHQVTAVCRGNNLSDTAEFVVVSPPATSTRGPDQDDRDTVTPNGLFDGAFDVSERPPGYDPGPVVRVEARLGAGEYISAEEHP